MPRPAGVALPPALDVCVTCEVRFVNAGLGVRGEGVGYQVAEAGVDDEDGRVGTEEEVDVCAVGV